MASAGRAGDESLLTRPADLTDITAFAAPPKDGPMARVFAANSIKLDRPLLSQMAIATVLVGSAAALSSAGIAVPVSQVGYAKGWDQKAPAAASFAPARAIAQVPENVRISVSPRIAMVAPRSVLAEPHAAMPRIAPAQPAPLVLARPVAIAATPGPAELVPLPVAPPVSVLAPPSVPVAGPADPALAMPAAAPVAAEMKLAASAPSLRLVNPPELRGFDLAKLSGPNRAVPAGFVRAATKSAVSGKVEGLGKKDTVVGDAVFHQVSVSVAGSDGKSIDVRIGADMKPSVKVGDLLALVSERMDPDSAARFAAAASAADYVSLATLRAAGFDVSYNAGSDSISIAVSQ
jgi:hypothetical protein